MAGIKAKDTKPELHVRRTLHQAGFRFRLHRKDLPGCPDVVLPKRRAVIFVHGCFWHSHGCRYCKSPETHAAFWQEKLTGNARRDHKNQDALKQAGWRVFVIWECEIRDRTGRMEAVMEELKQTGIHHVR